MCAFIWQKSITTALNASLCNNCNTHRWLRYLWNFHGVRWLSFLFTLPHGKIWNCQLNEMLLLYTVVHFCITGEYLSWNLLHDWGFTNPWTFRSPTLICCLMLSASTEQVRVQKCCFVIGYRGKANKTLPTLAWGPPTSKE